MIGGNRSKTLGRALMLALGIGVVCFTLSNIASAQLSDKKTVVTFSAPFEIPGSGPQVLPAGTYTFKIVDHLVDRNVVQISNKEEDHVYSTILAIPIHRELETDKTVMTFKERAVGQPQAIRTWFYPYERMGQEFVYPKEAPAVQVASDTYDARDFPQPVAIAAVTETAAREPVVTEAPAPIAAVEETPAPEPTEVVTSQEPPATTPEEAPTQIAALPKTASGMPFLTFIGMLSLATGLTIRKFTSL